MLLLLLHRVAVIVATREHPPQIRTSIDEKRRGGAFGRAGRICKDRWGINMKTK
ncbi:unnamed protein product, partial [Laminaria digitata]